MSFNAAELAICRSDRQNLAFFFRAVVGGSVLRLTATTGDYPVPADGVETTGGLYLAAGSFGPGLPDIDMAMNGAAQGLTLQLSGVDTATVQSYILDRDQIVGAPAALGWAILDDRYRPAGPIRWPLRGKLFNPRVRRVRKTDAGWERAISVTLVAGSYLRRRGLQAYATAAGQRARYPSDAFFDRIALYARDSTRKWPN